MSELLTVTAPEANDDRYVAICTKIKLRGEAVREEFFQAIEKDDFDVKEHVETIRTLDFAYMVSLQKGMKIVEANNRLTALANPPPPRPEPEEFEPTPLRKTWLGKVFGR